MYICTSFIPLSIPKDKNATNGSIKYEDFDVIKYTNTSDMYRPSYKETNADEKDAKLYDNMISKTTGPETYSNIPYTLCHENNIRYTITCINYILYPIYINFFHKFSLLFFGNPL